LLVKTLRYGSWLTPVPISSSVTVAASQSQVAIVPAESLLTHGCELMIGDLIDETRVVSIYQVSAPKLDVFKHV
jgi:hypothetical protein